MSLYIELTSCLHITTTGAGAALKSGSRLRPTTNSAPALELPKNWWLQAAPAPQHCSYKTVRFQCYYLIQLYINVKLTISVLIYYYNLYCCIFGRKYWSNGRDWYGARTLVHGHTRGTQVCTSHLIPVNSNI